MTKIDDGGAAFPEFGSTGMASIGQDGATIREMAHKPGMTLRDWFAGQALPGLIALDSDAGPLGVARDAYCYADAMILAQKEPTDD